MSVSPARFPGLLVLAFISGVAATCMGQSQAPPPVLVPLASAIYDLGFVIQATETRQKADALEAGHHVFEAMQLFEKLISSAAELPPGLQHGYQFDVILAACHLDAARTRIAYGEGLHELKMREENQGLIMAHLNAIPGLVVAASQDVDADAHRSKFKADAYTLLAAGQLYVGVLNSSAKDLDVCIKAYQKLAQTDPNAAVQARRMIKYVKGLERQVNHSIFSYDNIVKLTAAIVKEAVPDVGGWLAAGIEFGAGYYKEHRSEPVPPTVR